MPKDNSIKSVLIIGSGPIVIGQACEFDYAGSQSARSIREEGIEVILINSNPATIMTDPSMADHVYLLPLTTKSIIQILKEHPQIDSVLPTMGGQTALNLCLEADEKGIWKDFNVKMIGVDVNAINITEDRDLFKQLLHKINVPTFIISGRHDEATPACVQPFKDNIKGATWEILERSSHMPHVEEQDKCMKLVGGFLDAND